MNCTLYQQYPDHIHRGVKLTDKKIKGIKGYVNVAKNEATFYTLDDAMAANPLKVFNIDIAAHGILIVGVQTNGVRHWMQEWWLNTKA